MIDLHDEALVPLCEVPRLLPLRHGRRVHQSTVYRWSQRGVRGRRLETVLIGGTQYTSREALARFAVHAGAASSAPPAAHEREDAARRRAEDEADSLGLG